MNRPRRSVMNADVIGVIGEFLDTYSAATAARVSSVWRDSMAPRLVRSVRTLEELVCKHPTRGWDMTYIIRNSTVSLEFVTASDLGFYRVDMSLDYVRDQLRAGNVFWNISEMVQHLPMNFILSERIWCGNIINNPEFTPELLREHPEWSIDLGYCKNPAFNESNFEEFKHLYSSIHCGSKFSREFKVRHLNLFKCGCRDIIAGLDDIDIEVLLGTGIDVNSVAHRADFTIDHIKKYRSHLTGTAILSNPNVTAENLSEVYDGPVIPTGALKYFPHGIEWEGFKYAGKLSVVGPGYTSESLTVYLGTAENVLANPGLNWNWYILSYSLPFRVILQNPQLPWVPSGIVRSGAVPYWYVDENINAGWSFSTF